MKIGIDLGTTNSVVYALKDNGATEPIKNLDGDLLTPSVVHYDGSKITVGRKAKEMMKNGDTNAVGSFKVDMGSIKTYKIAGRSFTPVDLSAEVLRYLKESAEKATGKKVTGSVITVPAYFTELQREATIRAGKQAGLVVDRIINEPTSAALSYGINLEDEQTVAVYDLGGGTFDISVLHVGGGAVEVVATAGDNHLGGDNFDRALAAVILKSLKGLKNSYVPKTPAAVQVITEIARELKQELSSKPFVETKLAKLADVDPTFNPLSKPFLVTQDILEQTIHEYIVRTVRITKGAIEDAGMKMSDIDEIILVGGSTRIPMIKELLQQQTGLKVSTTTVDPDLSIAAGAAIQASIIEGSTKDLVLLDVTPFNLSVELEGGFVSTVIKAQSPIPYRGEKILTTSKDNQTEVVFRIRQGNMPLAEDNEYLGEFTLSGIKPAQAGIPQFEVSFEIDANGGLLVTAFDISSGKEASITRKLKQ